MAISILVGIIGFIIYLYVSTRREENKKLQKAGGFFIKYYRLISYFKTLPNIEVINKTNTSISLRRKIKGGFIFYTFSQGYGQLRVNWKINSYIHGDFSDKWAFEEYISQEIMINGTFAQEEVILNNIAGIDF